MKASFAPGQSSGTSLPKEAKSGSCSTREEDALVAAELCDDRAQVFCGVLLARRGVRMTLRFAVWRAR